MIGNAEVSDWAALPAPGYDWRDTNLCNPHNAHISIGPSTYLSIPQYAIHEGLLTVLPRTQLVIQTEKHSTSIILGFQPCRHAPCRIYSARKIKSLMRTVRLSHGCLRTAQWPQSLGKDLIATLSGHPLTRSSNFDPMLRRRADQRFSSPKSFMAALSQPQSITGLCQIPQSRSG